MADPDADASGMDASAIRDQRFANGACICVVARVFLPLPSHANLHTASTEIEQLAVVDDAVATAVAEVHRIGAGVAHRATLDADMPRVARRVPVIGASACTSGYPSAGTFQPLWANQSAKNEMPTVVPTSTSPASVMTVAWRGATTRRDRVFARQRNSCEHTALTIRYHWPG